MKKESQTIIQTSNKTFLISGLFVLSFLAVCSIWYYKTSSTTVLTCLMLSPTISVVLAKLLTKESFDVATIKPKIKDNRKMYLFSYFAPPILAFLGAGFFFLIFPSHFDVMKSTFSEMTESTNLTDYMNALVVLPLAMLLNPLMGLISCFGEEFTWRGYLLPKLSQHMSIAQATILSSVIWGMWHSPIVAMGYNYGTSNAIFGVFAMVLFCIVIGTITSYLYVKSNSVWTPTIFHSSLNAVGLYAPSDLFMDKDLSNPFIGPDLTGIVGGAGFILIAILSFRSLTKAEKS